VNQVKYAPSIRRQRVESESGKDSSNDAEGKVCFPSLDKFISKEKEAV